MKMKAVIATDSKSLLPLRGRHHPFTRPRAATLSPPVHEATGGHAVRGNYCTHNHIWVILRIIITEFKNKFVPLPS